MTQPPETKPEADVRLLDGVGIMPQGEPELAPLSLNDLPAAYQPKQAPVDPELVERASEEFEIARQQLMTRVFALMSGALLLTAAVAWLVGELAELPDDFKLRQIHFQILFFCELASVVYLARIVPQLRTAIVGVVFVAYAAFNGISFAVFAPYLPHQAVAYGFLLTSLAFLGTLFYARQTRLRLESVRAWATMLGFGFVLIVVGKLILGAPLASAGAAFIGITFFCNLVSYHADDIEGMYLEFEDDTDGWKAAFCGALLLYLDFVNLYILTISLLARLRNSVTSED
jgi:FtsH-binding integral membrane protein